MARQRQVTYYKNDGSGATANFVHDGLADVPLDFIDSIGRYWDAVPEDWSRANYIFVHWNTAADDSGTTYRPGETARGVNAQIYAIWAPAHQPKRGGMHFFLGSVGKAEAFRRGDDGQLTLAFVSKTLTDSGLNISTTKDDIRAGEGAPIQFSFYHDSSVDVTLTDVLWKREYLEAQLGARFANDGQGTDYITDTLTAANGKITICRPERVLDSEMLGMMSEQERFPLYWSNRESADVLSRVTLTVDGSVFTFSASQYQFFGRVDNKDCTIYYTESGVWGQQSWEIYCPQLLGPGSYSVKVVEPGDTPKMRKIPMPCADGDTYMAWYSPAGQDDWKSVASENPINEISVDAVNGTQFCVRYLAADSRAKVAEITSSIIPEELFLVITAPIFAGDACAASRGKAAGHITFEIPRFQLNGAQEFAMNMSSNQTISLSGVALASAAEDCDTSAGKLLRIIEVIANEEWYTDVTALVVDEECLAVGATPVVYAVRANGSLTRCDLRKLIWRTSNENTYTPMTNASTFVAGVTYININNGDNQGVLSTDEVVNIPAEG